MNKRLLPSRSCCLAGLPIRTTPRGANQDHTAWVPQHRWRMGTGALPGGVGKVFQKTYLSQVSRDEQEITWRTGDRLFQAEETTHIKTQKYLRVRLGRKAGPEVMVGAAAGGDIGDRPLVGSLEAPNYLLKGILVLILVFLFYNKLLQNLGA